MVQVGGVGMAVPQRLMPMPVGMAQAVIALVIAISLTFMGMLVMGAMGVLMLVLQRLVDVFVGVTLGERCSQRPTAINGPHKWRRTEVSSRAGSQPEADVQRTSVGNPSVPFAPDRQHHRPR